MKSTTQMIGKVEQMYATALLELAEAADQVEEVAEELSQITHLSESQPELVNLICTPIISMAKRSDVLEKVFKARIGDLLYRFLQVVNRKQRLQHLAGIAMAFDDLVNEKRGRIEVEAYVASTMDDAAVRRVSDHLGKELEREVVLHLHEDPNLIGGLKLRIGDRLIDGSVAAQLRLIRQSMINAGREQARSSPALRS